MRVKISILVALVLAILAFGGILLHKQLSNADGNSQSTLTTPQLTESKQTEISSPKPKNENNTLPQMPPAIPVIRISEDGLFKHIKALAGERYNESDRDRARNYISQVLQAAGWSPTLQTFEGGVNVVAERPGTDPQAGKIILSAHYDTVKNSPGVDDNASGVATVLEVARLLGKIPTSRTLQVIFFDLEERGLLGSFAFAGKAENLIDLQGAIVLDMVGFACHSAGCQRYPQGLPIPRPSEVGDFLAVIGDSEHLLLLNSFAISNQPSLPPVITLPVPLKGLGMPDVLRSDHAPFWYKGIGAVFVTDTADFRNPHYHRSSDTIETIDREFFLGTATIVAKATATLLQSRENLATTGVN